MTQEEDSMQTQTIRDGVMRRTNRHGLTFYGFLKKPVPLEFDNIKKLDRLSDWDMVFDRFNSWEMSSLIGDFKYAPEKKAFRGSVWHCNLGGTGTEVVEVPAEHPMDFKELDRFMCGRAIISRL